MIYSLIRIFLGLIFPISTVGSSLVVVSQLKQELVDKRSSVYDIMLQNHNIDSILSLDFNQRCDLYFKTLYSIDPNYSFDANDDFAPQFNSPDFARFKREMGANKNEDTIRREYKKANFVRHQPKIRDTISILRVFNKCYIGPKDQHFQNQKPLTENNEALLKDNSIDLFKGSHTFEKRIYPWLSGEAPIYEDWTGKTYFDVPGAPEPISLNPYWFNRFQEKFNGRGIVLTIGEKHIENTERLIRVLRALKNKYPIQILVDEDFSLESKQRILAAARDDFTQLPFSYNKVASILGNNYWTPGEGLPRQDIWFVNIKNSIVPAYWPRFNGFTKKLLANIFNSFEEFMLIDCDSVILESPEFFFKIKEYQDTGAYFFKDRSSEFRGKDSINFFKSLGPSIIDNLMFDIPMMTSHTLNREFFKGLGHYMESGLVLFNKKQHFRSLLMMLQLSFFEPVNREVYGEKEYYWLGMAFDGDESYEFEPNFAAAIGNFSKEDEPTKEICSSHPAHLSAHDGHLLWINSGFRFCERAKMVDYNKEASIGARFSNDPVELRSIFESLLRPSHGIIPPIPPTFTYMRNRDNQPSRGWVPDRRYCRSKLYCAYSRIGGDDNPEFGQIITFNDTAKDIMAYYGDVWLSL
ncbi:uncharacterized protein SPAPADRAFT_69954 [Spathaspora passalidarum NRRL Y-27907]|uniref:Alpha-1,3-mannosyltransferase n=1 Tax=Spathaspora passalidarum (strain NRRL Y-27907 / 11-Y1) TaxID=619300 RepID=G3AF48_SPAPN|nr:uncharacterized protein SPAPADRAFT_69954 [Spathaspora passalidarum NRRL Y-27907]EGW35824.1 hypothetical protein SPAPADRAFT_69954 [Spathaspora passalidarum NRRL Y-27907]